MAIRTGIPPSVWADEGEAAIATAIQLLTAQHGQAVDDNDGPQMNG